MEECGLEGSLRAYERVYRCWATGNSASHEWEVVVLSRRFDYLPLKEMEAVDGALGAWRADQ